MSSEIIIALTIFFEFLLHQFNKIDVNKTQKPVLPENTEHYHIKHHPVLL